MIKESIFDDFLEEQSKKIQKATHDAQLDVSHSIAKSVTSPKSEIKDPTRKSRVMHAALGALSAMALTPVFSRLNRSKKISIPLLLANTASLATTGYFTPDISNMIKKEVRGKVSPEESKRFIRVMEDPSNKMFNETKEISELYGGGFKKESSLTSGTLKLIGKTIKGGSATIGKGLYPRYGIKKGVKTPWGRKALSFGVRGGLTAGALYGGYKGIRKLNAPRSGSNYTTFLRNQTLAGNIHPNELSQQDLISVRKLGMR